MARLLGAIGRRCKGLWNEYFDMTGIGGISMRSFFVIVLVAFFGFLGGEFFYSSADVRHIDVVDNEKLRFISGGEYKQVDTGGGGNKVHSHDFKMRPRSSDAGGAGYRLTPAEKKYGDLFGWRSLNSVFYFGDEFGERYSWVTNSVGGHSDSRGTTSKIDAGTTQFPRVEVRSISRHYLFCGQDGSGLPLIRDSYLNKDLSKSSIELGVGGGRVSSKINSHAQGGELPSYYVNPFSVSGWGSSSMARMATLLSDMVEGLEPRAAYYNGGKGGEHSTHIAGRIGSIPFQLTVAGGEIPASGGVLVVGSNVKPSESLKPFTGWLNGVYGEVSSTRSELVFTRVKSGVAVPSGGEFPFLPEVGPQHRGDIVFLWMGKNDINTYTPQQIIERTDVSFDWLTPFIGRGLVLGHFHNSDWRPESSQSQTVDMINAAYKARYGELYVDVQSYLMSGQIWTDTGITPTVRDLKQQSLGQKPVSLSVDKMHMNDAAYLAITRKIQERILRLGWY